MAETIIAAKLTLDDEQATASVKSFRTQLKEATNDLIAIQAKFGETSKEAIAAAKGVAELKAQIKDAKEVADLFNPEKKFQAFGNAVRAATGGVTALTGAMALFGDQSKDVQEALLKVQGALALTEGVNTLADAAKDFTRLKTVAVDAFNAIKASIGATGIGAILLAVAALVAYWDDIRDAIGLSTAQERKYLEETTKASAVEKDKLDLITSQNNALKEQGKTQTEILNITNKQVEATINAQLKQLEAQKAISDKAIATAIAGQQGALTAGNLGFIPKLLFGDPKKTEEEAQKTNAAIILEINKLKDQLAAGHLAIIKETSDYQQKLTDLEHAAANARITDQYLLSQIRLKQALDNDERQAKLEYTNLEQQNAVLADLQAKYDAESAALAKANAKKLHDDLRKLSFDAYTAGIQDQTILQELQLKFQLENDIEATKQEIANIKDRNEKILALEAVYQEKVTQIKNKALNDFTQKYIESIAAQQVVQEDADLAELEAFDKKLTDEDALKRQQTQDLLQLNQDLHDASLDQAGQQAADERAQLEKWYAEKIKLAGGNAKALQDIYKVYEKQQTLITQNETAARLSLVSGYLGQAAQLFGQATVAGKALAIAQVTIDTFVGAQKAFNSLADIPYVGYVLGIAAAAATVVAGLARVKQIVNVQVPGASGGGGGSVPSISDSAPAPVQITPQVSSTQLPQDQINQIGNAAEPIKVFVVESDITDSQQRISRLNRAARLGD